MIRPAVWHPRRARARFPAGCCAPPDRTEGVAIIAAEPKQLTIVNIVGPIDLAKLAQLQGQFGVPQVGIAMSGQAKSASAAAQAH